MSQDATGNQDNQTPEDKSVWSQMIDWVKDHKFLTAIILIVAIWVGIALFSSNSKEGYSEDQKELYDKIINKEFDPISLIGEGETPLVYTSTNDDHVDYDQVSQANQSLKEEMVASANAATSELADITVSTMDDLMLVMANMGNHVELYPTLITTYLSMVDIWQITTKPFIDASAELLTATTNAINSAVGQSLQPTKTVYIADVTDTYSKEEGTTVTTVDSETSAGLLCIGGFNLLGGSKESNKTNVSTRCREESTRQMSFKPYYEDYEINADLYETICEQADATFASSMALLQGTIGSFPSPKGFVKVVEGWS